MGELRESKKRETRQRISDVATALFFERGFEAVTVDEIAAAAKVSKMTVFNYFARKEELMLDREDDLKLLPFRQALRDRPAGQSPVDALRTTIDALSRQKHPLCAINSQAVNWWRVLTASPSLQARLRELGDEAAEGLATELAGGQAGWPDAAHRRDDRVDSAHGARGIDPPDGARRVREEGERPAFLALVAQGLSAVETLAANGP